MTTCLAKNSILSENPRSPITRWGNRGPSRQIRIGDIFRVPQVGVPNRENTPDFLELTKGIHSRSADTQKGMFFYASVREPGQDFTRLPAFIFHSNPYKKDTEGTPWIDIIEPDVGYALYHGDNKTAGRLPLQARGNHKF